MNRLDRRFAQLREAGRSALIPYITAGHPVPSASVPVMHALVEAGADVIELGMPFTDVMADGPVIQDACAAALENGMTLAKVIAQVAEFRRDDAETPVILMGYMNPLERRGLAQGVGEAAEAGVDGMLIVDCPVEEAGDSSRLLSGAGLHQIHLAAPTTSPERLKRIAAAGGGFTYLVALKGVTGAATLDPERLREPLAALRAGGDTPVCVGFGVKTPQHAAAVAGVADGVVIGSALVAALAGADDPAVAAERARAFLEPMREAVENSRPVAIPARP